MLATLYPKSIDSGIQTTDKPNKLLSVMTVCKCGFHNGVMAYMLQFGYSAVHRTFQARVVFVKAIFSCLNLRPDDGFLPYNLLRFLIKLDMALQTLQLPEMILRQCFAILGTVHISTVCYSRTEGSPPWLGPVFKGF